MLVDGVTKLSRINFASREQAQAENYRKMIVAMAQRPAGGAHQARRPPAQHAHDRRPGQAEAGADGEARRSRSTPRWPTGWASTRSSGSSRTWRSTRCIPAVTPRSSRSSTSAGDERERYVDEAGDDPEPRAERGRDQAEISGRAKHFYSIYAKMAQGGKEFNEIYDLTAMRVLVDSVKDCYGAIGVIHSLWKPMPGRFKDYVAMPKVEQVPVAAHDGDRAAGQAARDPGADRGDAPDGRVRHRRPLALQDEGPHGSPRGGQRRGWVAQLVDWQDDARDPGSSWTRCASTCSRTRSTSSRPRARSRACRPARRRSTSPTPCTPTSATAAWARRSTGASCRCTTRSSRATSSRS